MPLDFDNLNACHLTIQAIKTHEHSLQPPLNTSAKLIMKNTQVSTDPEKVWLPLAMLLDPLEQRDLLGPALEWLGPVLGPAECLQVTTILADSHLYLKYNHKVAGGYGELVPLAMGELGHPVRAQRALGAAPYWGLMTTLPLLIIQSLCGISTEGKKKISF